MLVPTRIKRYKMVARDQTLELLVYVRFLLSWILGLQHSIACWSLWIEMIRIGNLK